MSAHACHSSCGAAEVGTHPTRTTDAFPVSKSEESSHELTIEEALSQKGGEYAATYSPFAPFTGTSTVFTT